MFSEPESLRRCVMNRSLHSGVKRLILPAGNKNDWQEVPDETRKKLKVHFIERIGEALPLALKA